MSGREYRLYLKVRYYPELLGNAVHQAGPGELKPYGPMRGMGGRRCV